MKFIFLSISFGFFAMMLTLEFPTAYKFVLGMMCFACAVMSVYYDRFETSENK